MDVLKMITGLTNKTCSICLFALLFLVSACAEHIVSDPTVVAAVRYKSDEAPYVELVTMVRKSTDKGAHSALIINASERVIFDPAGTFQHAELAEVEDVHHGATDRLVSYYQRYHARFSHYVHVQRVYLDPATAEGLLKRAQSNGAVSKMFCSNETANVLKSVPQFSSFRSSMFPEFLRLDMAEIPNVENYYVDEDDDGQIVPTD